MGWVRQRAHPRADRTALATGASRARMDRRRTFQPVVMGMIVRSDADANVTAGLAPFVETLRERQLFERGAPLTIARAPGRLDVMGGIADYSGSLMLERPIAEATWAAVQRLDRPVLEVVSLARPPLAIPLRTLAPAGAPVSYVEAGAM